MAPLFSVLHAVRVGYSNLVHVFARLVTIKTVLKTALYVLLDGIAALKAVEVVKITTTVITSVPVGIVIMVGQQTTM